jgi:hypothetical protein
MRKASVVAGSIAAATAGSAIFGGVALACNHHHSHHKSHHCCDSDGGDHNTRGGDAFGGKAINNCLNLGIPILSGNGILGQGEASGAGCYASADAAGGDAY